MCLITEQKRAIRVKKDLTVFKLVTKLNETTFSPWSGEYDFTYKLGVLHEEKITRDNNFNSYHDDIVKEYYPNYSSEEYTHVHKGFHCAETHDRISNCNIFDDNIKVECIIPKGALIYKDKTGLIVSSQIIIKKILS